MNLNDYLESLAKEGLQERLQHFKKNDDFPELLVPPINKNKRKKNGKNATYFYGELF